MRKKISQREAMLSRKLLRIANSELIGLTNRFSAIAPGVPIWNIAMTSDTTEVLKVARRLGFILVGTVEGNTLHVFAVRSR